VDKVVKRRWKAFMVENKIMIEDTLLLAFMHQKRFVVKLFHVTRSKKKV
jgi:hypothetical protein